MPFWSLKTIPRAHAADIDNPKNGSRENLVQVMQSDQIILELNQSNAAADNNCAYTHYRRGDCHREKYGRKKLRTGHSARTAIYQPAQEPG